MSEGTNGGTNDENYTIFLIFLFFERSLQKVIVTLGT